MRLTAVVALVLAFLAIGTAFAADPINLQLASLDEQPGRIAATVSVVGPDGRPITGLGTPNFKATLGDTPLNVSDLLGSSASRQPASVVLLVDVSGSMGGEAINTAKAAMQDFVRTLDPGDQVSIITFGNKATLWQDYTADRALLNQSISRINTAGDTALYEGVIAGLQKISEAPPGRRLVVLLSDGSATTSLNRRAETIGAAAAIGVNIVAVGVGNQIDRPYLTELTAASGGRLLATSTSAALRAAYADIANAIRSQYTVILSVPKTVDRSVPAKLTLQVTLRADTSVVERDLGPLAGAVAPPFDVKMTGVKANQLLPQKSTFALTPKFGPGVTIDHVDYSVDGKPGFTATVAPFKFDVPTSLGPGSHLITAKAWDTGGRSGESQIAFSIKAPPHKSAINGQVMIMALLGGLVAILAFFIIRKKKDQLRGVAGRVRPFAKRSDEPMHQQIDGWPTPVAAPQPMPVAVDRAFGRIVVMDEAAVRGGNLDAIREYEIKTQPLTLGTGEACDIRLEDDQGRIAAEEARLWIQRGRLVYHKLTTLSAMATEGVTSGWEFLESGEEMRLGPYRILFEEYVEGHQPPVEEPEPEPVRPEEPLRPVQEHGMSLSDLWTRVRDETQLSQPGE